MEDGARRCAKTICSRKDLEEFSRSETYEYLISFVLDLNESVKGKSFSSSSSSKDAASKSKIVLGLISMIEQLSSLIDSIPPLPHRSRFGNESYTVWFDKLQEESPALVSKLLSFSTTTDQGNGIDASQKDELCDYFTHSFGDRTRIDYGSGHEAHFIAFLACLAKLGYLSKSDHTNLVFNVFQDYITLMRKLQTVYWLEPAGSHGVWGLDDYHFLPFVFGSSQLIEHKYIRPKSIRTQEIVTNYSADYMYLECIRFINTVKTGSLVEHSPMLVDISGVRTWAKVNEGMIKMYRAELLGNCRSCNISCSDRSCLSFLRIIQAKMTKKTTIIITTTTTRTRNPASIINKPRSSPRRPRPPPIPTSFPRAACAP